MTFYRPPFGIYSERREAQDPNPALRRPWDGCWAWTAARAIDGTTGGTVHGDDEDSIRALVGKPDRAGVADGGNVDLQLLAVTKRTPKGTWYSLRPTAPALTQHLEQGGIALLSGWESNAPAVDRQYDPAFYDRKDANGHAIMVQGTGDGSTLWWGNPEMPADGTEPRLPIAVALTFVWRTGSQTVEALLLNSVRLSDPVAPKPPPNDAPAAPIVHIWNVKHGAAVRRYTVAHGVITGWDKPDIYWTGADSNAPCTPPQHLPGKGGATVVKVTAGTFAGRYVRVAPPKTFVTEKGS